ETNYVDLGSSNTVKVTFTGEGNQRAIFKRKSNLLQEHEEGRTDPRKAGKEILDMDLKIESFLKEKSESEVKCCKPEEPDYTDMYLNSRCESESESEDCDPDESDHDMPVVEETESHYITTHEIQLTELDHDMDHELGRAASSCWDYEDDNLVYSFVDYASFKSGEQTTGEKGQRRGTGSRPPKLAATKALISTESECASSDDGVRNNAGRIHVSVKASSQRVSEPVRTSLHDNDLLQCYHETQASKIDSHAHCFIPAPGRQHLASKLMKGKDVTEYSSGASSSVSELDDADKEVRNLTAKSFRSLACPYFDTIDLRPSSESSVSEHSLSMNKWSSFVDFKCQNCVSHGGECKNSTCSMEMKARTESGNGNVNTLSEGKTQQMYTMSSKYKQSCDTERRTKCIQSVSNIDHVEGEHKNAVFASSLLQDLILKKMRFDQEHKLERGKLNANSPPKDSTSCKVLQSQTSESGSVHSVVSVEDVDSSNTPFNEIQDEERDLRICESKVNTQGDVSATRVPGEGAKENKTNSETIKMSRLHVPGSHFLSKEREVAEPPMIIKQTTETDPVQSDEKKTCTMAHSNNGEAPEITICLRSIKENKNTLERPFNSASLLTPKLSKHSGNTKSEKVPHFTVRDVRDTRCKLQTPIHQVRDVRKLVKSSYRLVSLESGKNKTASCEETDGVKKEPDKNDKKEKIPMVIKCHSVNTNSNTHMNANLWSHPGSERSSLQPISEQQEVQMKTTSWKESRVESKMVNQAALEKLKAAVKTMEQLYVFDRNEWRRKTEAPRPVTDSHVLSLITSEEQGVDNERLVKAESSKLSHPCADTSFSRTLTHHLQQDVPKIQCPSVRTNISSSMKSPFSIQICPSKSTVEKRSSVEGEIGDTCLKSNPDPEPKPQPPAILDSENYLTIPIKSRPLETKPEQSVPPTPQPRPPLQRSPGVMESWSPDSPVLTFCQPAQILCVTPPVDLLTSNTQRKLLLDPVTGQCYLVDTPIALQPVTQRLYCPDSAQYLDVPVALSSTSYLICPSFAPPHSNPPCSQGEGTGTNAAVGGAKPIISISSQQGPRVVAPPSFDGTTMSFVMEHR
ncbi:hypothetical protein C0J50_7639, partial [Silurus asotus]